MTSLKAGGTKVRGAWRTRGVLGVCAALLAVAACQPPPPSALPDPAEAAGRYREEVQLRGNVLEVRVDVPRSAVQGSGGALWARSGPYYYLFSVATRDLFAAYPGLAAVRVVTQTEEGEEIARALLARDDLNPVTWRHALAYASLAQTEGTENPRHVAKLVREGEDVVTEYAYNPTYAGN